MGTSFGYGEHIVAMSIRSEWIEIGGLRIHCLMAGQTGSPVLLLHGGGYDSASLSYGPIIGPISRSHRVFAPDWPGYGESDKPDLDYTTEYYETVLGRLMDALGLEKVSLVGISMGGAISLGFSLRSPQRVGKLILVDSHGLGKEVPGRVVSYAVVRLPLLNRLVWAAMGRSRRMVEWSLRIVHLAQEHGHGLFWEGHLKLLWTENSDGPRFTLQTTQHSSSLSGHRASARG